MARITVEDCVPNPVKDRFLLVIIATQRTKELNSGISPSIEIEERKKKPVIALKEIAQNKLNVNVLHDKIVETFQSKVSIDRVRTENLHAEPEDLMFDGEMIEDSLQQVEDIDFGNNEGQVDFDSSGYSSDSTQDE